MTSIDMYQEVLKYGAMIVDALRGYTQPVFVYLPPHGELRGGAWVVVDPTINPAHMEMYAGKGVWFISCDSHVCVCVDRDSRGGVLESEGTVEIKFRRKDIIKAMNRLDSSYNDLQSQLKSSTLSADDRKTLEASLSAREESLASTFHQVAVEFANLHDTPGRMHKKGCVSVSTLM